MAFTLKAFREITNGFARGHHFNLGILDFKAFGNIYADYATGALTSPLMSLFCSSMTLPSKIINPNSISVQSGIPAIKIANDIAYPPWTVTFYSDELLIMKYMFNRWQELVNNSEDKTFGVPSDYKSNIAYGAVLSPQSVPTHCYTFKGLWPSEVSNITVSQQDTTVLQYSVTFQYDYFEINELAGFLLSVGHELTNSGINAAYGGSTIRNRSVNAPYGLSLRIPF